jgi:hypothetical protein
MTKVHETVESLLTKLQRLSRVDGPNDNAMSFRLPPDLQTADSQMLHVSSEEAAVMHEVVAALADDLRFEHIDKARETVRDFVARAWSDRQTNQVKRYVRQHAREPVELTCFVPIEYLKVEAVTELVGLRLLPPADPNIPARRGPWVELEPPIGSVAAVKVTGTNRSNMASRAQKSVECALRIARVGLRDHNFINSQQLRFRVGTSFAFDDGSSGWSRRADAAFELTIEPEELAAMDKRAVWGLPTVPKTDIEEKAALALAWMERARFTAEPLVALLYLFFALEALLGDRSEGLKADGLAFRQLVLSHVVTNSFRDPNKTWFLYDKVRSAAVHGEPAPEVDDDIVRKFESSVRDTLNQYLMFAADNSITKRGRLITALTSHPDVPLLADWITKYAGADWRTYLGRFLPPGD